MRKVLVVLQAKWLEGEGGTEPSKWETRAYTCRWAVTMSTWAGFLLLFRQQ